MNTKITLPEIPDADTETVGNYGRGCDVYSYGLVEEIQRAAFEAGLAARTDKPEVCVVVRHGCEVFAVYASKSIAVEIINIDDLRATPNAEKSERLAHVRATFNEVY